MQNIGFSELIVILMILVLVFGASRLPDLGESVGKAVRNLKRGLAENEDIQVKKVDAKAKSIRPEAAAPAADSNVRDAELVDDSHEPKA